MRSLASIIASLIFLLLVVIAGAAPRPNVLILVPDALSYGDFSHYNPQRPRTPSIYSLACASLRLTDFHVSPTCAPSRAALMTGRPANAAGVWHTVMGHYLLPKDEITLADEFKVNGYRTGLFGKWHLGDQHPFRPNERGSDHTVINPHFPALRSSHELSLQPSPPKQFPSNKVRRISSSSSTSTDHCPVIQESYSAPKTTRPEEM